VKKSAPDFQMTAGGDEDLGAYAAEAGIEFFGRRRRRRHKRRTASFGKRRSRRGGRKGCRSKSSNKKLPARIRKLCKRLGIKTTKKVGHRRVCKSMSVIKKQIARKMRSRRHRR
jgi:hypothetical protein